MKEKFRIDEKMRTHCQRVSRVLLLKGLIYHQDSYRLNAIRISHSDNCATEFHVCEKKLFGLNHYLSLWTAFVRLRNGSRDIDAIWLMKNGHIQQLVLAIGHDIHKQNIVTMKGQNQCLNHAPFYRQRR